MKILLIDDDAELCALLVEFLTREGFAVECEHEGTRGLDRALHGGFDLVILDVMLPGLDGFEILRRLRAESRVPVLMLTARGEDMDRISGLEMGADDYLAKPFNPARAGGANSRDSPPAGAAAIRRKVRSKSMACASIRARAR